MSGFVRVAEFIELRDLDYVESINDYLYSCEGGRGHTQKFPLYLPIKNIIGIRMIISQLSFNSICKYAGNYEKYPIYILTFTNKNCYGIDGSKNEPFTTCIAHPLEDIQRIISGKDNISDLVHELRFNPNLPIEPRKAQKRFENGEEKNLL